jgi:hypothetical protein
MSERLYPRAGTDCGATNSAGLKTSQLDSLADKSIVIGVRSDPKPKITVIDFNGEGSIPQADTN